MFQNDARVTEASSETKDAAVNYVNNEGLKDMSVNTQIQPLFCQVPPTGVSNFADLEEAKRL